MIPIVENQQDSFEVACRKNPNSPLDISSDESFTESNLLEGCDNLTEIYELDGVVEEVLAVNEEVLEVTPYSELSPPSPSGPQDDLEDENRMSVRKHMYSRVVTSFKKSMRLFISCVRPDQRESQEIFGFTARKEVNITRNEQTVGPWKLQEQSITDSTICNPPETEITEENEIPFLALQEESMGSLVTDELSEKSSSDEVILPVTQVLPPSARTSNNPITSVQPGSESLFQYYQKRIGRFIIERHEHLHARFTIPLLPEVHEADVGKKCLVLDLDETLIHSQFNKVDEPDLEVPIEIDHGTVRPIYVSKRPGVDQFLAAVGQHFEVVIFTASLASYADPVIDFLDQTNTVKHRLYRDSCVFVDGLYLKDLSRLGRSLDQITIIDNAPISYLLHPNNGVSIISWFSDKEDTELLTRILPALEQLQDAPDVYTWKKACAHLISH